MHEKKITEVLEYGVLAQNNEGSALSIKSDETYAHLIVEKIIDETQERKIKNLKEINNSDFYVIKVVDNDGNKIYGIRKTDDSWRSRKQKGVIPALFSDESLDINKDRSFNISSYVDFFIVGEDILIDGKPNFESVLSYKIAHIENFQDLTADNEFTAIFAETQTITNYVGSHKIRLRRALAIREKGHYKNQNFMSNLKNNYTAYGLDLQFDNAGKLLVTLETCGDVFTALLDHRLTSPFSQNIYDVQDTAPIVI